jgi:cation-transporting ATPase 13A1
MVLSKLKEGGMSVAMVTGDALLTAIHVAKEVNICDSEDAEDDGPLLFGTETNRELQELLESKRAQNPKSAPSQAEKLKKSELKSILILEQDDTAHMYWQRYDDDSAGPSYAASEVPEL